MSNIARRGSDCLFILVALGFTSFAQTTIATGNIQGTLTDPSSAAVAGAKSQSLTRAQVRNLR